MAGHPGRRRHRLGSERRRPPAPQRRGRADPLQERLRPGRADHPCRRPPRRGEAKDQMSESTIVRRLLYVEDNEDNLYMLTLYFDVQGGYEILSAANGPEGIATAAAEQP